MPRTNSLAVLSVEPLEPREVPAVIAAFLPETEAPAAFGDARDASLTSGSTVRLAETGGTMPATQNILTGTIKVNPNP